MVNSTELLKEYNLKVTPQRVAIVDELNEKGHINIDDLYKSMLEKFPSISLATIYKNIHSMIDKLFISEVKIPNQKPVYELTKVEHSHLICEKCDMIEDIDIDISNLINEINEKNSFTTNSTSLILTGICKDCSK